MPVQGMIAFFMALLGWMPPLLQAICFGVFAIFFIVSILRVIALILDVIPFL